ncbi:hypothetical protein AMECASPLE_039428 [Ameca splendens]|uniref:Uncharacterized protein n=1 Tax=Ameca splendens TaxID=208324 RepID=A0ABV0Z8K6_9TELE
MCQPGNWARSTNRPKPSTTCQPPQCRYKTCSTTPPSRLRLQPGARLRARATEGSIGGRSPLQTKDPGKPHTPTPEASQHTVPALPHCLVWHIPTHQTGQPAPPPKRSHIPITAAQCPAKTPRRNTDTKHSDLL